MAERKRKRATEEEEERVVRSGIKEDDPTPSEGLTVAGAQAQQGVEGDETGAAVTVDKESGDEDGRTIPSCTNEENKEDGEGGERGEKGEKGEKKKVDFYLVHIDLTTEDEVKGDAYGVRCVDKQTALDIAYQAASSWVAACEEVWGEPDPPVLRNETGWYRAAPGDNCSEDGAMIRYHLYDVWVEEVVLSSEPELAYDTNDRHMLIDRVVSQ